MTQKNESASYQPEQWKLLMLNREKMKTKEDNLRELWANIKCIKIPMTGVPDGGEREKGTENVFGDMTA